MNNTRLCNCSEDDIQTEEADEQEATGEEDKAEEESASDWDSVDPAAIYAKWSKKQGLNSKCTDIFNFTFL